ncbi:MAG: hypothetical protein HQL23_07335 [Candidatus Omnitrophica bacterium]|nr:hypothetical protein [Candidatus Omnitrophota bacterium]
MKNKNSEFEISFYEGILVHAPNFFEVLVVLGDLYTKNGHYRKGLMVDERLAALRADDPVVLYNLACSYSLVEQLDLAYRAIKQAVRRGYYDFDFMSQDQDLENLRRDTRFRRFLQRLAKRVNQTQ